MSFSYDAGTSTPNRAGLVEVGSIRINDGTFQLLSAPGLLWGTPGVREGLADLSNDHGSYAGLPFYGAREFTLNGEISVPTVDDLWGAIDLLYETFNLAETGLKTLTLNTAGWSATRQIAARIDGEIEIAEPSDKNEHLSTRRRFSVPLVAPDPRIYSTTEHNATVTSGGTSLTNAGKIATPFRVRFNGAQTANMVLSDPDGNTITVTASTTSGHYIEVQTRSSLSATATALDDLGVSKFADISDWSAASIAAGSGTWTATKAGGTGTTVIYWRDAWV